ncbi:MAG: TrkH family potassium uptake protein [Bacteroidales bacterium]|nr:TrkH family potassium uptake protein [Candidatus Hennigimonas equi]
MNVKAVTRNVGLALLVSSLFMLLSVVVSVIYGRDSAFGALSISCIITALFGIFPLIFVRKSQPISLQDGFVIIALSWLLSFVFGMLPYAMWGGEMSIVDAWFESVSGFTTTGATILNDIESLPRSLLFWRSCTHFIGGLGVVVFMLLIVPSASPFRQRLTKIEVSSLFRDSANIQSRKLVYIITFVYLGIFLLATVSLFLAGMPLFDAINHGLSLCATGGFSIRNASIAAYDSVAVNAVALLTMIIATTNFVLIYSCVIRRSFKPFTSSHTVRFYLTSMLVTSVIVVLSLRFQGNGMSWDKAISDGFLTTVSYMTTTGFTFADNSAWPFLSCIVLMYVSIQCATAGSTSSGIKVDRMMVVFKSIHRQILSNLHPAATGRIRLGSSYMPEDHVLPILLYIVLYFLIIMLSTGLLLTLGVGGIEAVSGSIACLGNVGPGLGGISAAGNYDAMPVAAKLIFTLDMYLGRIEIYPLLIAVTLIFKRDK